MKREDATFISADALNIGIELLKSLSLQKDTVSREVVDLLRIEEFGCQNYLWVSYLQFIEYIGTSEWLGNILPPATQLSITGLIERMFKMTGHLKEEREQMKMQLRTFFQALAIGEFGKHSFKTMSPSETPQPAL